MSSPAASHAALFEKTGLDAKSASAASTAKYAPVLAQIIDEGGAASLGDKSVATLLNTLASKLPALADNVRKPIVVGVVNKGIKSDKQIDAAIKYAKALSAPSAFEQSAFEKACGIGAVVTVEEMRSVIASTLSTPDLATQRYRIAGRLLGAVTAALPWADGAVLKQEFDDAIVKLIGPKSEEDSKKVKPAKEPAKSEVKSDAASSSALPPPPVMDWLEMLNGREIPEARNTEEIINKHREVSKGKPRTRFPPEPNGYLHIGHAKAMNFNFGLARKFDGVCIMRFDDTNPEAEKGEYIDNILENVRWLGHNPAIITYSSDYFQNLYDLAVRLIKRGKAYIDHQTAAEIKESRETKIPSPWRDRPIEESLKLFEDMRKGKFAEGAATLRMKGDLNHPNPQMWDLVAYRIKYSEHPHVGNKWCIYPSYDYSHCIIDSLEDITHSCCTLEFEVRRESYYWLLHELDIYKPKVWEYSRLNIEHTVMSKRRLLRLVMEHFVKGWDDPRLPTLNGLRRKGVPPEAINLFCETIGVSRTENTISMALLDHCIRTVLEPIARRAMVVVEPVKIIIENWPAGKVETCTAPNFPKDESLGSHTVPLTGVLYVDSSDIRAVDDKDFFGLAPGKEVHLKYAYNIKCTKVKTDATGKVTEAYATIDFTNANKPKGKITWVAEPAPGVEPLKVELRLYDVLFKSADPMSVDDWITDLNPESLVVVNNAYADPSLANVKAGDKFQFERVAFFMCDPDSKPGHLVFNRTVLLKESKGPAKEVKKGKN